MNSLQFWNNFQKPTKFLYLFSILILFISLIIFGLAYFRGLENVIHWDVLSELGEVPIVLDQFKVGNETLSIPSKTFIVTEQFVASPMAINMLGNYLFLGLFMIGFILILSALSALKRFWYLIFMGSVILLIVTFNLGLIFNLANNYINIGAIILYIGTSYFFHAFRPDINILKRFFIFFFILSLDLFQCLGNFLEILEKCRTQTTVVQSSCRMIERKKCLGPDIRKCFRKCLAMCL